MALRKGQFICTLTGEILNEAEQVRREETRSDGGASERYVFELSPPETGDALESDGEGKVVGRPMRLFVNAARIGGPARFFNHSCEPNVDHFRVWMDDEHVPKIAFFANRNVQPLTELRITYKKGQVMTGQEQASLTHTSTATATATATATTTPTGVSPYKKRKRRRQENSSVHRCFCGAANCQGTYLGPPLEEEDGEGSEGSEE